MHYPSAKTLQQIPGIDAEKAKHLRAILTAKTREPLRQYKSARTYELSCYHPPDIYLLKLYAADEVIGGFGIEAIDIPEGSFNNCQNPDTCIEYVNLGDTYAVTLCRIDGRNKTPRYVVSSYGDLVERYE